MNSQATIPTTQAPTPAAAAAEAAALPLSTRFELGAEITPVQRAFLDRHGFIIFSRVLATAEVERVDAEINRVQRRWLDEGRKKVYGIPVFVGKDPQGQPFIQRFAFTSQFSTYIRELVRDERFYPVRGLIGDSTRVGDEEKDGVVFNRNLNVRGSAYPRLGWHTDGFRDLFLNRAIPGPMLNVGIHFDHIRAADGGLRLIPGSPIDLIEMPQVNLLRISILHLYHHFAINVFNRENIQVTLPLYLLSQLEMNH